MSKAISFSYLLIILIILIIRVNTCAISSGKNRDSIVLDSRDYARILQFFEHLKNSARKLNSIRFRGIIHAGDCSPTKSILSSESSLNNITGSGIVEASRYLDCDPQRGFLEVETGEHFVFGISNRIFHEVKEQSFFKDRDIRF